MFKINLSLSVLRSTCRWDPSFPIGHPKRLPFFQQCCFIVLLAQQVRGSIVVSISARHAEDPGSNPGRGEINTRTKNTKYHPTQEYFTAWNGILSATGTRTRVARVRAEYPNQLDYSGCGAEIGCNHAWYNCVKIWIWAWQPGFKRMKPSEARTVDLGAVYIY